MAANRHSRQVVAFDARGMGWEIRESADENSPPPHAPVERFGRAASGLPNHAWAPTGPPAPAPIRSSSPVIRNSRARVSLLPITNVNELVLKKEIGALETELARVKRAFLIQDRVVDGFCRLRIEGGS
jgi:hypothetical protein